MATVKMTGTAFKALKANFEKYSPKESMVFAPAKLVKCGDQETYLVSSVIVPDENEAIRSTGVVWPSDEFQLWLYSQLKSHGLANGYRVITIHNHPFQTMARFSCIDWSTMTQDREIYRLAYDGHDFLWLVFSKNAESFEGCVVKQGGYVNIDRLIVYGDKLTVLNGKGQNQTSCSHNELYSRMLLIPEWDQDFVASLRIGVIGLGGIGASVIQSLLMLGIGDNAETVLVDSDVVEESNLSRIPYGTRRDINNYKVHVGKRYMKRVRPFRKVTAIKSPRHSPEAQKALSGCDVLIGCVDNDFGRACSNYLAASFMIPSLDLGAGVIIQKFAGQRATVSSGQVRLFVPGATPCLLCNMGLDHEDFDREILKLNMNDNEQELLAKTGYLQNFIGDDTPEPSVYVLNATIANLGLAFLTKYLLGGTLDYHTLHYTMESMQIQKLRAESKSVCPVCGDNGTIGSGKFFEIDNFSGPKKLPLPRGTNNGPARHVTTPDGPV